MLNGNSCLFDGGTNSIVHSAKIGAGFKSHSNFNRIRFRVRAMMLGQGWGYSIACVL